MKARLIQIGNSRGVRIPKPLIEEAGLGEEVDLQVREGAVVIQSVHAARAGWADAARDAAARGESDLLDGAQPTRFGEEEWEW